MELTFVSGFPGGVIGKKLDEKQRDVLENKRIKSVYNEYLSSGSKARAWKKSVGKEMTWEQITCLIDKEIRNSGTKKEKTGLLEIGCSSGGILKRISKISPSTVFYGLDIRTQPLIEGRLQNPQFDFVCGNGADLPFTEKSVDMVFQFVCLSSIKKFEIRKRIYHEIDRVLKPGGIFVSLDLRYWSPNPNVVSISRRELQSGFPGSYRHAFYPVWLLPPIQRLVAAKPVLHLLNLVPVLKSHWLSFLRK